MPDPLGRHPRSYAPILDRLARLVRIRNEKGWNDENEKLARDDELE